MKKKQSLPKFVFVVREGGEGEEYLVAYESIDEIEHGVVVGIYEFKETKTVKVAAELV